MAENFIERLTLGSSSTQTSASISGSYRHLVLRGLARSTRAAVDNSGLRLRFNGDTGSNYQNQVLYGVSTTTGAAIQQAVAFLVEITIPAATSTSGFASAFVVEVPFYSQTTFQKHGTLHTANHTNGTASGMPAAVFGFAWANTAAITTVTAYESNSQNFATGSFLDIYGID